MTVIELIERLAEFEPNAEVVVNDLDGDQYDVVDFFEDEGLIIEVERV